MAISQPTLEVDYLVIGAGAAGMGFVDVLLTQSQSIGQPITVAIVDKHSAPGGHWNDAYPFVCLHQPSYYYGVESRQLGDMSVQQSGMSKGMLQAASASEILAYYQALMTDTFLPSGKVSYWPLCSVQSWQRENNGGRNDTGDLIVEVKELGSGAIKTVHVKRRIIDTTHYAISVPSTHKRQFTVEQGLICVSPNDLPQISLHYKRYTVLGSGKTGMDACLWLLDHGVQPSQIRWIMPRDAWWIDRRTLQLTPDYFEDGILHSALQMEALGQASSVADLFVRLEASGALLRLDPAVAPRMFHGATVTEQELDALREIKDVVREGRVKAITTNAIEFVGGRMGASADDIYVDCTAQGIGCPPLVPVFSRDVITLQILKIFAVSLSPGLIAYIELNYADDELKNDLCQPVEAPQFDTGWLPMMAGTIRNLSRWSQDEKLSAWLKQSRLDPFPKLQRSADPYNPEQQLLLQRARRAVKGAMANLPKLMSELNETRSLTPNDESIETKRSH